MKRYSVKTFREAGLEAKWTKTRSGAPVIAVRNPKARLKHQRESWWIVDRPMWKTMERTNIQEGFDSHTILGDIFSIEA